MVLPSHFPQTLVMHMGNRFGTSEWLTELSQRKIHASISHAYKTKAAAIYLRGKSWVQTWHYLVPGAGSQLARRLNQHVCCLDRVVQGAGFSCLCEIGFSALSIPLRRIFWHGRKHAASTVTLIFSLAQPCSSLNKHFPTRNFLPYILQNVSYMKH